MEIDKTRDVKRAYDKAIQAFSKKINDNNADEVTLAIDNIEKLKESYVYNNLENKKRLGLSLLFGLSIISLGVDIGTREYEEVIQVIVGNLTAGSFSIIGLYSMIKSLGIFQHERVKNQVFAEDTLEELSEEYKQIK